MLEIEKMRLQLSGLTSPEKKSCLGQYFTSARVATFMVSLFPFASGSCKLLDPGAGIGSLSHAFMERCRGEGFDFSKVDIDVVELDESLLEHLHSSLGDPSAEEDLSLNVFNADYIEMATKTIKEGMVSSAKRYTHVIMNPPYKKINSKSEHRLKLRTIGIETVNLYSAFISLAIRQMENNGQLVAIIPRSFCNGPYYRSFRKDMLRQGAIRHIHLFESRNKAFKNDGVLQENIILRFEKNGIPGEVTVSTSDDDSFNDLSVFRHDFNTIVLPGDDEKFIHIPTSDDIDSFSSPNIQSSLNDLGLTVSTGPIVGFRVKGHLEKSPVANTVPLLYPSHFGVQDITWPVVHSKKPNAIHKNPSTQKGLYPMGFYCVVKRHSSKEQRRRIITNVVNPKDFVGYDCIGFENKLNVFHENKKGLSENLARGLSIFLSSSAVDEKFRRFNGNTQVNATDLRAIKYPNRDTLEGIGEWSISQGELSQEDIDKQLELMR